MEKHFWKFRKFITLSDQGIQSNSAFGLAFIYLSRINIQVYIRLRSYIYFVGTLPTVSFGLSKFQLTQRRQVKQLDLLESRRLDMLPCLTVGIGFHFRREIYLCIVVVLVNCLVRLNGRQFVQYV